MKKYLLVLSLILSVHLANSNTAIMPFMKTGTATFFCSTPTNLTTTFSGSNGWVILGWGAVTGAIDYTLEYMAVDGSNHAVYNVPGNSANYYGSSSLRAKFRVKANCAGGSSSWSEWKEFGVTS